MYIPNEALYLDRMHNMVTTQENFACCWAAHAVSMLCSIAQILVYVHPPEGAWYGPGDEQQDTFQLIFILYITIHNNIIIIIMMLLLDAIVCAF